MARSTLGVGIDGYWGGVVRDIREYLVQILPKAPNLAHIFLIPYYFDF